MVKENLVSCLNRIEVSAASVGTSKGEVALVVVAKGVSLPLIFEAIDSGIEHIAENRIQEALLKFGKVNAYAESKGRRLVWHMVGHLQTNKAKEAVRMFDLIHSVDSLKVAFEIDRQAGKINKIQDILIEVKTSGEAAKYGFAPDDVPQALEQIKDLKNMRIKGLMTIAPMVDDPEKARSYFRKLKELLNEINFLPSSIFRLPSILSMGMTNDFEVAIQEGANMVRIGRGIFK